MLIDHIKTTDPAITLLETTLTRRAESAALAEKSLTQLLGEKALRITVSFGDQVLSRENPAAGLTINVTGETDLFSFNFSLNRDYVIFNLAAVGGIDPTDQTALLLQNIATALKMPFFHTPIVPAGKINIYQNMGYKADIGTGQLTIYQEMQGYRPMMKKYEPAHLVLPA